MLVAQPFTKDEYFQPRPSAASFDASASASSAYAPSNYVLRDRVARVIGPIATYAAGDKKGQLVAPDVEAWFKADKSGGNPHIVAQWADAHNSIAQAWVTGDPTHGAYVDEWAKGHDGVVKEWIKKNPATPQPKASDLAVLFFETFSNDHPGMFPSSVTQDRSGRQTGDRHRAGERGIRYPVDLLRHVARRSSRRSAPRRAGRSCHRFASGLDPDITLANAEFQLDRVAAKWADDKKLKADDVRTDIEALLQQKAYAPWSGAIGETLVNVLDVNLELHKRYGDPA